MIEYNVIVRATRTEWFLNGLLHREDGPAVEWVDGDKSWYKNGELHREDGPAVERHNFKSWYLNGKCHREDGPAVEWDAGTKIWYLNGKPHREDGPAVEWENGDKRWWLDGEQYSEEEFNRKMNLVKELTVEEISNLLGYEVKIVKG